MDIPNIRDRIRGQSKINIPPTIGGLMVATSMRKVVLAGRGGLRQKSKLILFRLINPINFNRRRILKPAAGIAESRFNKFTKFESSQ